MSGLTPKRPGQRTLVDVSKVPAGGHQCPAVRRTGFMETQARSLRLDARELDHLGPFLGFGCNESAELGGAKNHWDGADIVEPRPDVRRSQPGIDLAVEPFDDLHWRAGGRADPGPGPRLVSRQRLDDGRHV